MEEQVKIIFHRYMPNDAGKMENVRDSVEGEYASYDIICEALKIYSNLRAEYYGTYKIKRITEMIKAIAQIDEDLEF